MTTTEGQTTQAGAAAPATESVDELIAQATQGQPMWITDTFREQVRRQLRSLLEDFQRVATDGEISLLTEVLEDRENSVLVNQVSPNEIPLARVFMDLARNEEGEMFRFPESALADVRAYDKWQNAHPVYHGTIGSLCELLEADIWFASILHNVAGLWRQHGVNGITPEALADNIEEATEHFNHQIEEARTLLRQYPKLVQQGEQ